MELCRMSITVTLSEEDWQYSVSSEQQDINILVQSHQYIHFGFTENTPDSVPNILSKHLHLMHLL